MINNKELSFRESLKGSCGPICFLAKKLFDWAKNGRPMDENKDNIFKDYHVTLIREKVIDLNKKRFHPDFVDNTINLSNDARRLRQVIANGRIAECWMKSNVWGKDLKLGPNFGISGSGGCVKLPQYSAEETEIDEFFSKFVLAVDAPNEEQLDEIFMGEIRHYSKHNLINQHLQWGDFFVKMLNWLKKKKKMDKDSWMTPEEGKQILNNIDYTIDCFRIGGLS